ncbi:MAG: hypothetical protein ACFE8J_15720 [Candidatus Heimdallarchaeota archaeon]
MKIEKEIIESLKKICVVGLTLIITVIIPLTLYIGYLNFGNEEFIRRIRTILIISISLGGIISFLTFVIYFLNPISRFNLALSILTEILYCGYIIIWSQIGKVYISTNEFLFFYDISKLILISLGIPLLLIIKTIINFAEKSRQSIILALILKSIENNNFNSTLKIRKHISSKRISHKFKLKDYISLISELEGS